MKPFIFELPAQAHPAPGHQLHLSHGGDHNRDLDKNVDLDDDLDDDFLSQRRS